MQKIKFKIKVIICNLMGLFFFVNCVSEFTASFPSSEYERLVVEGNVIANSISHFYLSKTISLDEDTLSGTFRDVNASLYLIDSNGNKSNPAIYKGNGLYELVIGDLETSISYGIEIEYEKEVYRSSLISPVITPKIDDIFWEQTDVYGDVSIYVMTEKYNNQTHYFIWSFEEDWEVIPYYRSYSTLNFKDTVVYDDLSSPYYYCWRKDYSKDIIIGTTKDFSENKITKKIAEYISYDDRFCELYSILVSQRALSATGYEYYLNKKKYSTEMGGLFTPQPSEIESNINCITNPIKKVIGYVDVVMNVEQQRVFIEGKSVKKVDNPLKCELYDADDIEKRLHPDIGINNKIDIYNLGYRPVFGNSQTERILWAPAVCSDCRASGGTKKKPDFWPNDHK